MSSRDDEEGTDRLDGKTELTTALRGSGDEPRLSAFWDGGSLTRPVPASGTLTIGRSSQCDVRIDHASVSRKHAILHLGAIPKIEDCGSANGTKVGGKPVTSGVSVQVVPGEVIELGTVVVVLQGGEAPPASRIPVRPARVPPKLNLPASATVAPGTRANETPMQRVERLVRLVAAGNIHVLLTGETGVGKELVAERIHKASRRANGPLVRVEAAVLSEDVLDAELFGQGDKPGLFEQAHGGTFFLDEVAELSLGTQAKLLRVLERSEVVRVGSAEPRKIDLRFIAATNRDLRALVGEGAFREDLYFRLNGITIEVPPLRERREQIAELARELLSKAAAESGRTGLSLPPEAITRLESYEWPGNVRELKNAIDRAVLLSTGSGIDPMVLPAGDHLGDAAAGARLRNDLAAFERQRIVEALEKCAGNQTKAAQLLGISRRTLVSRLGEYNLPRPRGGGGRT
jgi:pSer/pThr/pTyr-binding forkhead associated (FHA) protein